MRGGSIAGPKIAIVQGGGIARSSARQLRFEFLNPHVVGGSGQEHALVVEMPLPELASASNCAIAEREPEVRAAGLRSPTRRGLPPTWRRPPDSTWCAHRYGLNFGSREFSTNLLEGDGFRFSVPVRQAKLTRSCR